MWFTCTVVRIVQASVRRRRAIRRCWATCCWWRSALLRNASSTRPAKATAWSSTTVPYIYTTDCSLHLYLLYTLYWTVVSVSTTTRRLGSPMTTRMIQQQHSAVPLQVRRAASLCTTSTCTFSAVGSSSGRPANARLDSQSYLTWLVRRAEPSRSSHPQFVLLLRWCSHRINSDIQLFVPFCFFSLSSFAFSLLFARTPNRSTRSYSLGSRWRLCHLWAK